ncbi:MAG: hypothetical protein M3P23_05550 [Actinomycetota bacterium]|nr:hypothetical protein [Actinomycetota bacterium]
MPILDLQKRSRELGRIRAGEKTPSGAPTKLDRFRVTSPSKALVEQVAALYGGAVTGWDNGGAEQWQATITATRLPVLVPPQPVSQFYELWSGGGCQRRCDGTTELLKDTACLCGPDVEQRACKPTTRLNVILRDVPGIGVWRLESHGYYAAVELPDVAEFLAKVGGYVSAWLSLEQRTVKRDGQTRRFMVPTLEVDVTPAQLLAGNVVAPAIEAGAPKALDAPPGEGEPDWPALITSATTREELVAIHGQAKATGMSVERATALEAGMAARARQIADAEEDGEDVRDRLWAEITAGTRFDTAQDLEQDFKQYAGIGPDKATAGQMRAYRDDTSQPVPA